MAKVRIQPDVLVLGNHPCCYLAAAFLQEKKINVAQATIPGQTVPDRLVLMNPKFFELHKITAALKKLPDLVPIHGLKFLGDDPNTFSEYTDKSVVGYVGSFLHIRNAVMDHCKKTKLDMID